jgi:hypothetical protein
MQSNDRKVTKVQIFKIKPKDDIRHTSNRIKHKHQNQCKVCLSVTACFKSWYVLVLLHWNYCKTIKNNYSHYEKFLQQRVTFFDPQCQHQTKVLKNLICKTKALHDFYGQFQNHKLLKPKKAKEAILCVLTFLQRWIWKLISLGTWHNVSLETGINPSVELKTDTKSTKTSILVRQNYTEPQPSSL